jgi:hypothetical protein
MPEMLEFVIIMKGRSAANAAKWLETLVEEAKKSNRSWAHLLIEKRNLKFCAP